MSKSKEFVSSDDCSSEEEVKPKKTPKRESDEKVEKKSKKSKQDNTNEEADNVWDLGNNRQVSVRDFKGKLYVDIREMYFDKDSNLKPGRKGICLGMPQWRKFLSVMEDVDKVVKSKC